jgi:hypothetical protein
MLSNTIIERSQNALQFMLLHKYIPPAQADEDVSELITKNYCLSI